jgi:lipopolysaccharide export system permease protein
VATLSRYFVARFVQFFAIVVIIASSSLIVVELMLNLDRMLVFGDGAGAVLDYLRLRLLSEYASYVVPVAAFIAAFATTGLSAYARELVAVKAGGIPIRRVALPLLFCGLTLAVGFAALHETVIVEARREWNRQRAGDENINFKRGSFWYHKRGRIYNVGRADRATRTLYDVRIFERDEGGRLLRSISAERIQILDEHRWRFEGGLSRTFDPRHPEASISAQVLDGTILEIADPDARTLLSADPAALPLHRLREFIAERERKGASTRAERTLLYARLADWVSVALLVGVAIPIGLGVERSRNLGRSAGYAVAVLAGFYSLRNVAAVVALQGVVPPLVASSGLLVTVALVACGAFWRAPR